MKGGKRTAIGARVTRHRRRPDAVPGRDRRERLPLAGRHARRTSASARPTKADLVEVRWPDGTTDEWKDVKANQILRLEQGKK